MPIWSVKQRGSMLACVLIGLLALAGCRSDQASRSGLASFRPPFWFGDKGEPASADEFSLKPVPREGMGTSPPAPAPRSFPPPAAPAPESSGAHDFYGVRRTAAEDVAAAKPSWGSRFRNLFGDDSSEAAIRNDDGSEPPALRPIPPLDRT